MPQAARIHRRGNRSAVIGGLESGAVFKDMAYAAHHLDQLPYHHTPRCGLRIQGKGRRVRPFFDFGLLAGVERNHQIFPLAGNRSHAVGGGMLGFGAAISLSEHWHVRPLARIVVLSTPEFGGFGGAAVGCRF